MIMDVTIHEYVQGNQCGPPPLKSRRTHIVTTIFVSEETFRDSNRREPQRYCGSLENRQISEAVDSASLRSARSSFATVSARNPKIRRSTPLLSYSRERRDPCTITCVPFGSVLVYSASLPSVTTRCQSVRLCHSPLSFFQDSFVATEIVVTGVP